MALGIWNSLSMQECEVWQKKYLGGREVGNIESWGVIWGLCEWLAQEGTTRVCHA